MSMSKADEMARRSFLGVVGLGVPSAVLGVGGGSGFGGRSHVGEASPGPEATPFRAADAYPQHDPARVQAVVGASHGNLERVRALVEEQPALAKASWDWGFGDWETALGAASHTGRREIADFLLAHGARPTIFSAAMMGEVDTVRAFLQADPGLFELDGPHGIPLLSHARAGGAQAERVVDFLVDRFDARDRPLGVEGDDAMEALYGGRYRFEHDPPFEIAVAVRNGWLLVGEGEPQSRVARVDEHVFHPTGAPAVRLGFEVVEGRARALTVVDGPVQARGTRVD